MNTALKNPITLLVFIDGFLDSICYSLGTIAQKADFLGGECSKLIEAGLKQVFEGFTPFEGAAIDRPGLAFQLLTIFSDGIDGKKLWFSPLGVETLAFLLFFLTSALRPSRA